MADMKTPNILSTSHIDALKADLGRIDKALKALDVKGGSNDYFKNVAAKIRTEVPALKSKVQKLEENIGTADKSTAADTQKKLGNLANYAFAQTKKTATVSYFYGKQRYASQDALQTELKKRMPQNTQSYLSQAFNDVVGKASPKDAAKVGPGVKHASSGDGENSATLFFTREIKNDGLEQIYRVVGVGSHHKSGGYIIHDSTTPKLPKGKVFKL